MLRESSLEICLVPAAHMATCMQMLLSITSMRHAKRELTCNVSTASTTCGNKYADAVVKDRHEVP